MCTWVRINRTPQVNRFLRNLILASPLLQHRTELFAFGFVHNPAAGIDLAESQRALLQYRSNLHSLRPVEERAVGNLRPEDVGERYTKIAGGVYAIVKESARLFTLASASRRIPHKEWEIPLPVVNLAGYSFYPGVDVIAFVELQEMTCVRWSQELTFQTYSDAAAIREGLEFI